ncbi:MAG: PAS domain-containing sensor histidine kinase [Deltaproteobacteria bacterium]|nr:PAS domain-containing sensor histidine kinase [Deltaproteobacteria bacterium]
MATPGEHESWTDEELLRFFTLSTDLFAISDLDGYFQRLNPAWERALGFTNEELCARPSKEFIHPAEREMPASKREKLLTGLDHVEYQNRFLCNDGSYRWILWNATVSVQRRRIYSVGRDITEQVEAEEQVRRLVSELEAKNKALLEAQEQKAALTAYIVHDLKNPLSAIVANAYGLQEEPELSEPTRESMRDIYLGAQAMDRMVLTLLDVSRSEDGALVPRLAPVPLATLLEEARASMAALAQLRQQKIELRTDLGAPAVQADPDLLRRIVVNLLDNSLKYAPSGTTIVIEARTDASGAAEIRIRDQGPGIPEEHRDRIFEKYVRLDGSSGANARKSRGLGLAFCRLAAEAQRGRVWAEPNAPVGTTFCVSLPGR